jgi:hypothetical protein
VPVEVPTSIKETFCQRNLALASWAKPPEPIANQNFGALNQSPRFRTFFGVLLARRGFEAAPGSFVRPDAAEPFRKDFPLRRDETAAMTAATPAMIVPSS